MSTFADIVSRDGQEAEITFKDGNSQKIRCFFQPILTKSDTKRWMDISRLGRLDTSRYYYMGPADVELDDVEGGWLTVGKCNYIFLKEEPFYIKNTISHWEAVLAVKEEEYGGI